MRFKLLENSISEYISQKDFNNFLQNNCSEYLKEKEHYDLYRGIKIANPENQNYQRFVMTPNRNRHPKDVDIKIQDFVDEFFIKKFGWAPRRTGVFATGEASFAADFGSIWKIYPSNGFRFLWSPDVRDLFDVADFPGRGKKTVEDVNIYLDDEILPTYINSDLISAIKSGHEIMINCDQYGGELV